MKKILTLGLALFAFNAVAQLIPMQFLNANYFNKTTQTNIMVKRADTATTATNWVGNRITNIFETGISITNPASHKDYNFGTDGILTAYGVHANGMSMDAIDVFMNSDLIISSEAANTFTIINVGGLKVMGEESRPFIIDGATGVASGDGSGLTNLNPQNISAGNVKSSLSFTNAGNTFTGNGGGLTNVPVFGNNLPPFNGAKTRVFYVGDSHTAGAGGTVQNYPYVITNIFGFNIAIWWTNASVAGRTLTDINNGYTNEVLPFLAGTGSNNLFLFKGGENQLTTLTAEANFNIISNYQKRAEIDCAALGSTCDFVVSTIIVPGDSMAEVYMTNMWKFNNYIIGYTNFLGVTDAVYAFRNPYTNFFVGDGRHLNNAGIYRLAYSFYAAYRFKGRPVQLSGIQNWGTNYADRGYDGIPQMTKVGATYTWLGTGVFSTGVNSAGQIATTAAGGFLVSAALGAVTAGSNGQIAGSNYVAFGTMNMRIGVVTNSLNVGGTATIDKLATSGGIPNAVTVGASPFEFVNTATVSLECTLDDGSALFSITKNGVQVRSSLSGSSGMFILQPTNRVVITYPVTAPTFTTNSL